MSVWDVALTIINVILAIISGIGAYNSVKYFRKSKNLTIFAQTNKALVEVQKMLIKLPEALSSSNSSRRGKKGLSLHNALCDIGQELNVNLTEINSNIPAEYSGELRQLQNKDGFNLQTYINSYISGDAVKDNGIDSEDFNSCQAKLLEIQGQNHTPEVFFCRISPPPLHRSVSPLPLCSNTDFLF